ncbi:MAG: ROK family transcriptional regulator [Rhodospirillales bacterium]|nr:ROK family transcriptional regulator [Rhodospirillales bacterium]
MTSVMRSDDVRKSNRRRVLGAVRRQDGLSRTDIQRKTGLSAATVSAITSNLIAEGVLIYPDTKRSAGAGRGRPKVALALNPDTALVGTLIFRHNIISAAVTNYAGQTVGEETIEIVTAEASPKELRLALCRCMEQAIQRTGRASVHLQRISIGIQGVIDIDGAIMLWSPISRQTDLPIKQWLEDHFAAPTHVSNDCDMIARALNWRDPLRYGRNFAAVLLADGVGMGLLLRGQMINGTRSSGTEFGHMTYLPGGALCRCGSFGCIEAYASAYAIDRRATGGHEDQLPPEPQGAYNIDAIANAARNGDRQSRIAIETAGDAIGTGLANIYALVDPFPIIMVGSGVVAFDLMEGSIRRALRANVAGKQVENIPIDCFTDEYPLVREGCMISALLAHDEQIADFGSIPEVVS